MSLKVQLLLIPEPELWWWISQTFKKMTPSRALLKRRTTVRFLVIQNSLSTLLEVIPSRHLLLRRKALQLQKLTREFLAESSETTFLKSHQKSKQGTSKVFLSQEVLSIMPNPKFLSKKSHWKDRAPWLCKPHKMALFSASKISSKEMLKLTECSISKRSLNRLTQTLTLIFNDCVWIRNNK